MLNLILTLLRLKMKAIVGKCPINLNKVLKKNILSLFIIVLLVKVKSKVWLAVRKKSK